MRFTTSLRGAATVVLAVSATLAVPIQPASAAPFNEYTGGVTNYLTYLAGTPKVMAVKNASTANGAPMVQFQFGGGAPDNDYMILERETTANVYRIKPLSTWSGGDVFLDKCLAVQNNDRVHDNVPIVNATCTYDSINNDVWFKRQVNVDSRVATYEFVNQSTGRCLMTQNKSTANGAPLVSFTCNGGNNSRWILAPS